MEELARNTDSVLFIAKDYIAERIKWGSFSSEKYVQRLIVLKYSDEQIQNLLMEFEKDANAEMRSTTNPKKAILFLGISILMIALFAFLYLLFLMGMVGNYLPPWLLDAGLLLAIGLCILSYRAFKSIKSRIFERAQKYESYN